jgi:hypothetical protein
MKYYRILFFTLITLFIISSQKPALGQDFKFRPKIKILTDTLKFKDLVEDYRYIKLETNKSCLLGEIRQLQFYKSKIYIMTDGLYCFDINGRFLFAINNLGRGPDEILQLYNFSVDDDKIYLNTPRKIMSYNCTTGAFLKSYKLDYTARYICLDGNKVYMDLLPGMVKEPGRVFITSLNDPKSVKAFLPDIENKYMANPFTGYNKQLYYTDPLLVQVFKIHNDLVEKYIFFDFGKDTPSKSDVESLMTKKPRTYQNYSKVFQLEYVYETPDFIVAHYLLLAKGYSVLFDKKSNKAIAWNSDRKTKIEAYQWFPVAMNAVYEDYFCMVVNGNFVSGTKDSLIRGKVALSPTHPEYKYYDIIMKTDVMDNPVIALYKFKNLK